MATIYNEDLNWVLEGTIENDRSLVIPINKNPFIIGRREDCDLSLPSQKISRRHTEIFLKGSSLMLKDLESTNGTFLNDKKITGETIISSGDVLNIGNYRFKIYLKKTHIDTTKTISENILKLNERSSFAIHYNLTNREEEILKLIIKGKSTKNIADQLFISDGTAKNHVLNIFKKTNVHSKFELLTKYNNFTEI